MIENNSYQPEEKFDNDPSLYNEGMENQYIDSSFPQMDAEIGNAGLRKQLIWIEEKYQVCFDHNAENCDKCYDGTFYECTRMIQVEVEFYEEDQPHDRRN